MSFNNIISNVKWHFWANNVHGIIRTCLKLLDNKNWSKFVFWFRCAECSNFIIHYKFCSIQLVVEWFLDWCVDVYCEQVVSLLVLEMWTFKLYINIGCRRHEHCHLLLIEQGEDDDWLSLIDFRMHPFNSPDVQLGWHLLVFKLHWRSTGSMLEWQLFSIWIDDQQFNKEVNVNDRIVIDACTNGKCPYLIYCFEKTPK